MTVIINDKNCAYFGQSAEVTHTDPRGIYLVRIPSKTGNGFVSFAINAADTTEAAA